MSTESLLYSVHTSPYNRSETVLQDSVNSCISVLFLLFRSERNG